MNKEEEDVVLLDRPVVYLEPDELFEDEPGFDDETAEYVRARVESDRHEVWVEDVELRDIEEPAQRERDVG